MFAAFLPFRMYYIAGMNRLALLALIPALATSAFAADLGQIIFQDDFDRNESQEKTDDSGNGWGTNSKARAMGDKQVDLKDGAMRIGLDPVSWTPHRWGGKERPRCRRAIGGRFGASGPQVDPRARAAPRWRPGRSSLAGALAGGGGA